MSWQFIISKSSFENKEGWEIEDWRGDGCGHPKHFFKTWREMLGFLEYNTPEEELASHCEFHPGHDFRSICVGDIVIPTLEARKLIPTCFEGLLYAHVTKVEERSGTTPLLHLVWEEGKVSCGDMSWYQKAHYQSNYCCLFT